ncbi:hypothetical protein FACS1894200_13580 [Spirochaetia bacterium]|nr:hypothetical protein FACS1894200_13580 [Spirochaetia bacterium]
MDEINETKTSPIRLKHFTSIVALAGILESGTLCLSDPNQENSPWEDKNDLAALNAYKRITGAQKIRVLCLAQGDEQIHHWFYYAKKDAGCCIHFKTDALLAALQQENAFLSGFIVYKPKAELSAAWLRTQPVEKLPFIKRRAFEAEQEYRVIWKGTEDTECPPISVVDCIDHITLGPGLAEQKGAGLKRLLETKYALTVNHSRLLKDDDWITRFDTVYKNQEIKR